MPSLPPLPPSLRAPANPESDTTTPVPSYAVPFDSRQIGRDTNDMACDLTTTVAWSYIVLPIVEHIGPAILQYFVHWLGSRTPAARIKVLIDQLGEKQCCIDTPAGEHHPNDAWARMRGTVVALIRRLEGIRDDGPWLQWVWSCVPCTDVSKRFTAVYDELKRFRVPSHSVDNIPRSTRQGRGAQGLQDSAGLSASAAAADHAPPSGPLVAAMPGAPSKR